MSYRYTMPTMSIIYSASSSELQYKIGKWEESIYPLSFSSFLGKCGPLRLAPPLGNPGSAPVYHTPLMIPNYNLDASGSANFSQNVDTVGVKIILLDKMAVTAVQLQYLTVLYGQSFPVRIKICPLWNQIYPHQQNTIAKYKSLMQYICWQIFRMCWPNDSPFLSCPCSLHLPTESFNR